MSGQRSVLVCYDIADSRRLRKVEKIMTGYGYRVQESVFFCRLSKLMQAKMFSDVSSVINIDSDQWFLVDLGEDQDVIQRFVVLGKRIVKIPKITFI